MMYKKLTFILVAVLFSLLPLAQADAQYTGNCIAGTINETANQCAVNGANGLTTVTFCDGTETSGPCRPDRINGVAAATTAANQSATTGQSCTAQMVPFPGIDPNTGLGYYYNITCGSGGTSGGGSSAQPVSSQQNYINSLMSILNSLITASKTVQNNTAVSGTSLPILPPVFVSPSVASNPSTTSGVTNSCYVFTKVLQYGDSGADVTALTTALKKEGFLSQVTSVFDTNVMTAVARFQEAHGTEILYPLGLAQGTGVVGSKTIAYLNSVCVIVSSAASSGSGTSCSQPVRSGIQNGKYQYTFSQNSNSTWTVTLNNPAYSTVADQYYVQANYAFITVDKADLNRQNQGRFNYLQSLPGTAAGNTEYANLFGSFNNAYYDWDNMTKATGTCTTP